MLEYFFFGGGVHYNATFKSGCLQNYFGRKKIQKILQQKGRPIPHTKIRRYSKFQN